MDYSRYPQVSLKQESIEDAFLDLFRREGKLQVERNVVTESCHLAKAAAGNHNKHAVTVNILHHCNSGTHGSDNSASSINKTSIENVLTYISSLRMQKRNDIHEVRRWSRWRA
jgi:hypothetical protein